MPLEHLSTKLFQTTAAAQVTKFHSVRPPQLPIRDYLFRIAKYFQCSRECFVLCLVYIDRIVKLHPDFTICSLNIHRLLVTSVMLAVKFFDDVYYSNAYYAKVGGVKTREVNILEGQFLQLIEWKLHVTPEDAEKGGGGEVRLQEVTFPELFVTRFRHHLSHDNGKHVR
ncbi:CYCU4-1 [Symbiodinium natans]|uniref:CYCU4-1 protein n=1 Tax=Symbiodinium natans TaxID=878477 RepID=A0A812VHE6_9DINO|nr:CYCU4-1 [Symbiodinium natans]